MSRGVALLLALSMGAVAVVAACGGHEESPVMGSDDGSAAADQDSAAALPPGVDHYHGNVACCAEDAGLCCSGPVLTCEAYVACVQAGEAWEPKGLACQDCCPGLGLTHLEIVTQNADGTCTPSGNGFEPSFVCSACGDGHCNATSGENHCSCPADCP